jgi:hypothetical protein
MPKNLVVNYWTRNLETAERISEIIEMSKRLYQERVNAKMFLDTDIGDPKSPEDQPNAPS